MQLGDVSATSSDCSALEDWIDFKPCTPVKKLHKFISWYKSFYL